MKTSKKSIRFNRYAEEDFAYWTKHNPKIAKKVITLLEDIKRNPFSGIGKPEQLKHYYSGCWSRRINQEHRLVYKIEKDTIIILSCRYHYKRS